MAATGAGWRRGRSDRDSGLGTSAGLAAGPTTASCDASTGGRSEAVCRLLAGADGRLREEEDARRLGRLANGTPRNWMSGLVRVQARPVYPSPARIPTDHGVQAASTGWVGVSLAKEGDEAVPAPTACVGDVCGATSCALRQFNHRMLWTARSLGIDFCPRFRAGLRRA